MKPRNVATYLLAALTLFGYGGLLLLLATLISPFGPGLSMLFQKVDLRILAVAMAVWAAGFMTWTIPHPGFRRLESYTFVKFLVHSILLILAQAVSLWVGATHLFDAVTRAITWSGIFFASLPSLRAVTGWVLRLFFQAFHRTLEPRPGAPTPLGISKAEFLSRGLQCLGICRRFAITPHLILIALDPEQVTATPAHPAVERSLPEQILFLLTENGRIFEPWLYERDHARFISLLLLRNGETGEAAVARLTALLGNHLMDGSGSPLRFHMQTTALPAHLEKNLALFKEPDLTAWIDEAAATLKPPTSGK